MKRTLTCLCFLIFFPNSFAAHLKKNIEHLIEKVDPNINIGISVYDLNTGTTIYQRNPNRAFIPASNMKLFSDAAALIALGPNYRYKTQLSTNASLIKNKTLKGSLYLHLSGDPSFTQTDLAKLLAVLKEWNIHTIEGNVVLVSQNRYVNAHAPGWMVEDLKRSYGAPLAPLILDENRLTITVNPAHKVGKKALIELSDKSSHIRINNFVTTRSSSKGCSIRIDFNNHNDLTVRGCVGLGQWSVVQRVAIRNPLRYAQNVVRQKLKDLNITLQGKVLLGSSVKNSLLLKAHKSKPITQLMADTLKPSDNLYADSLFLHTAASINQKPINWKGAHKTLKIFLERQTGIDLKSAILTDGSGLSRHDQLTPRQTVHLLRYLHENFPLSYEYISALPIAGRDGTLQKRFRKQGQKGLIRAKTGTMKGVVSLSGYLYTANAHTLAFAIFINGMPGTSAHLSGRYRYLVDALCDYFLKQKPKRRLVKQTQKASPPIAFQKKPSQAELSRNKMSWWRKLESTLKRSLKKQNVAILYRNHELIIHDHNPLPNAVWLALKEARKTHAFAIVMQGTQALNAPKQQLLWVKAKSSAPQAHRLWKIRENI